jgi:lactate dehydrogenase-like 2-hydroxyacid dehydrogenase
MPKTFLVSTESDPVGNAVDAFLGDSDGYFRIPPDQTASIVLSSGDSLLVGELEIEPEFVVSDDVLIQFLSCNPSFSLRERLASSGAIIAGISPVIASRVANRVVGFGGPLRVKPDAQWGIVGFGEIGAEVAKKLNPTEASVITTDVRTPRSGLLAEFSVRRFTLDLLFAGSDAVSLNVPVGPTASPLISERELNLMKDGAVLINTSDSSIVDEEAVVASLVDGPLGGYATDRPGEVILGADDTLASSGKLFATTNPLTNQIGAAQQIAKYIALNIEAFQGGSSIQGSIDSVDFPKLGDPSFWSSRMSPRQD